MIIKLHNRICSFRLVFLLVTCTYTFNTPAQILYTDIDPDFTSTTEGDFYHLDLNNDFVVDFGLGSLYFLESNDIKFLIYSSGTELNSFIAVTPWYTSPVPLNTDSEIFTLPNYSPYGHSYESYGWFTINDCFGGDANCYENWGGQNDKYLGLRFLINGMTHFGWARLNVTSPTQWILKDYAYNATPNQTILAGQMTLGLEESHLKNIKIGVSNGLVSIFNLERRIEFNLYHINGQRVLHGEIETNNYSINVQHLSSGIYIFELIGQHSEFIMKRKLVIP